MEAKYLLLGAGIAAVSFGGFFLRERGLVLLSIPWRKIWEEMSRALRSREMLRVVAVPGLWLVLFYALVVHVRGSLGRWPRFGEPLEGWLLDVHMQAVWGLLGGLLGSLYFVVPIGILCLFLRGWRHVCLYSVLFGAAVGLAFGAVMLAPGPFLNWFFD